LSTKRLFCYNKATELKFASRVTQISKKFQLENGRKKKEERQGKRNKTGKNKGEKGKITKEGRGTGRKLERKGAHCA
jgi:hypothetical protein